MNIDNHIDHCVSLCENEYVLLCEMANKYKEETLLPVNIWIDEAGSYEQRKYGKIIKFQLNKAEDLEIGNTGSMDLEGNIYPPHFKIQKLNEQDLCELRNFVRNNRCALERIADQEVRLYKIWPYMIKGGEVASQVEINTLKIKVDMLAAEKRNIKKLRILK